MQPDLIQGEVEPDLAATNAGLWAKYDELKLEFDDIETTNSALHAKIMAKNLLAQENGGIWSMMAHEPLVNNWLSQTTSTASIFLPYQTSFPPNYQPMHTPTIQT